MSKNIKEVPIRIIFRVVNKLSLFGKNCIINLKTWTEITCQLLVVGGMDIKLKKALA